jgi:hypothetical protein
MNAAVGPLSTSPSTIGLTATTGAVALASASWMPGTARIGAIEANGLDGPITIALAPAIAASACSLAFARSAPRYSRPSIMPAARSRIMNSWNVSQPAEPVRTHVRTGSSLIGSTCERTPMASFRRASAAVADTPSASIRARSMHHARSRSPRLNQTSTPSSRRASITAKLSPRRPQPRSSIASASQKDTRSGSGETCAP